MTDVVVCFSAYSTGAATVDHGPHIDMAQVLCNPPQLSPGLGPAPPLATGLWLACSLSGWGF